MWEAVRLYRQVRFVCMGRPDGNQRQSDGTDGWHAIGGNQKQSEAIRGNQSGRVACDRRQSEAIRGNQRQSIRPGWHARPVGLLAAARRASMTSQSALGRI